MKIALMRRVAAALIGFVLGASFYLLLIDTANDVELYVLAGAALLAAILFESSREQGFAEAAIEPRWLRRSGRVALSVPVHIVLLCREALAQLVSRAPVRGSFRAVPFRMGADSKARDAGRCALAEALGSLAPNTIVIGIDPERDLLLVHQLRRRGGREQLDVLDLG